MNDMHELAPNRLMYKALHVPMYLTGDVARFTWCQRRVMMLMVVAAIHGWRCDTAGPQAFHLSNLLLGGGGSPVAKALIHGLVNVFLCRFLSVAVL